MKLKLNVVGRLKIEQPAKEFGRKEFALKYIILHGGMNENKYTDLIEINKSFYYLKRGGKPS